MSISTDQITNILKKIKYPGFSRDIVSFGMVKNVDVQGSKVNIQLLLPKPDEQLQKTLEENIRKQILEVPGVSDLNLDIRAKEQKQSQQGQQGQSADPKSNPKLPKNIKYYIAVASGKGGVGKSTIAVNLALAISKKRKNVGLMDADVWGPSAPIMMGINEKPVATGNQKILPIEKFGLKTMSIGYLINEEDAVIWRGPMVHGAVKQFIEDVEWGNTEYLIIDLPPGTGDAQLSLAQTVPINGGVIVTTPQDVALIDVKRGVLMFNKLNISVMGIVENMSYLDVENNGNRIDIFGTGGGRKMAEKFNVPFLGEIPLDPDIRKGGDAGTPIVESKPDSNAAKAFFEIADIILESVEKKLAS